MIFSHEAAPDRSRRLGRFLSRGVAATVVVGLHALVAVPLMVRSSSQLGPDHPRLQAGRSDEPLLFIGLIPASQSARPRPLDGMAIPRPSTRPTRSVFDITPPQIEMADESPQTSVGAPPVMRRIAEITSGIQSAWVLPVAPGSDDFQCDVRVRQVDESAPREIYVEQCDENATLRTSLLKAIRAAAPWPTRETDHPGWDLTLHFTAYGALASGQRSSVQLSASSQ